MQFEAEFPVRLTVGGTLEQPDGALLKNAR